MLVDWEVELVDVDWLVLVLWEVDEVEIEVEVLWLVDDVDVL